MKFDWSKKKKFLFYFFLSISLIKRTANFLTSFLLSFLDKFLTAEYNSLFLKSEGWSDDFNKAAIILSAELISFGSESLPKCFPKQATNFESSLNFLQAFGKIFIILKKVSSKETNLDLFSFLKISEIISIFFCFIFIGSINFLFKDNLKKKSNFNF